MLKLLHAHSMKDHGEASICFVSNRIKISYSYHSSCSFRNTSQDACDGGDERTFHACATVISSAYSWRLNSRSICMTWLNICSTRSTMKAPVKSQIFWRAPDRGNIRHHIESLKFFGDDPPLLHDLIKVPA